MQISKFDIILKKIKMKKIDHLLLTTLLLFFSFSINAQTANKIIENYIENTGGADNWAKVKSIKKNITVNQMGMEFPVEQYLSSERTYSKISLQEQEIKQAVFDGETLWTTNLMSGKAEKIDQENAQILKDKLAEFPDPFLNYKENGFTTELIGNEVVDGYDTFKVKLTKKPMIVDGKEVPNVSIYYFNTENFFPIMKHEEVMSGPGKGMIMEAKMSDYQEIEGLYMPFSLSQGVKDQPGQPLTITSIELNVEADDSEFKFPETETELQEIN